MRAGFRAVPGWSRRVGCGLAVLVTVAAAFAVRADAVAPRRAFLIGDSVTVGAAPAIERQAPAHGWALTVDAKVGRTTAQGASILASMRGSFPPVVVVALGNNDGQIPAQFASRIDAVMRALAGVPHVVWYTMTPFASWVPAANAVLQAARARWSNLRIADWATVSETTPGALYGAGPHLRAPGAQAFADLFFTTLASLDGGTPVVESFDGSRPRIESSAAMREAPVAMAAAPGGARVWFATPDGQVEPGSATPTYGSLHSPPRAPIVGISATASGRGYWLVGADGGVFSFGDARFYGSTGARRLNRPIVGMHATPSGRGYWLVATDGGVFSFGDARFSGSTGAQRLNRPIVGMYATPSGRGYWLVATDGGVFSFGDARFSGSTGARRLNRPIVGMHATPSGRGYWLVATDGGVFSFGDARFSGSTGARRLNQPVVAMCATPSGRGYWLLAADGGVFSFGDARYSGSGAALHAATGASFLGIAPGSRAYELGAVIPTP